MLSSSLPALGREIVRLTKEKEEEYCIHFFLMLRNHYTLVVFFFGHRKSSLFKQYFRNFISMHIITYIFVEQFSNLYIFMVIFYFFFFFLF